MAIEQPILYLIFTLTSSQSFEFFFDNEKRPKTCKHYDDKRNGKIYRFLYVSVFLFI